MKKRKINTVWLRGFFYNLVTFLEFFIVIKSSFKNEALK